MALCEAEGIVDADFVSNSSMQTQISQETLFRLSRAVFVGETFYKICNFIDVSSLPSLRRTCSGYHAQLQAILSRSTELQGKLDEHLRQALSGGKRVWVAIRARPQLETSEKLALTRNCVTVTGGETAEDESFFFDRVFDGTAQQSEVWSDIQPQLMRCMIRREHACLFAYGQTGSGKTHTMFGNPDVKGEEGIAFRAIKNLSDLLLREAASHGVSPPTVDFSFLEVYNEKVHDLLDQQRLCQVSEERVVLHPGDKFQAPTYSKESYVVPHVTRVSCDINNLVEQVGQLLQEGAASRMVGKTVFNPRSSRSHAVATLHINWKTRNSRPSSAASRPSSAVSRPSSAASIEHHIGERGHDIELEAERDAGVMQNATSPSPHFGDTSRHAAECRMYLVDLAGSERAGQYALSAGQLKEGVNINQSLSTLGRVVGALARGTGEHVPYRDSILTWLLSDAITGRSARAFMVAAVQPQHPAETLSTLRYAHAYSTLQSDLSTRIPKVKSQVRQMMQRREYLIREFDALCFQFNMHNTGLRWDMTSLNDRHVKVRRTAKQHFERHPYLRWVDGHEGKFHINAVGIVRDVVLVPPVREPNDLPDGRKREFGTVEDGDDPGNVVKVYYEGRHGFAPTILWYPEAALEDIRPPQEILRLLREAETVGASLKTKQKQLRNMEKQFQAQRHQPINVSQNATNP